jgi:2-C-methyl-D-erythritol 4-phosphate cytidylyltransferase
MIAAIILAAGASSRMGGGIKKEYRELPAPAPEITDERAGEEAVTVLRSAFTAFAENSRVSLIIVVHPSNPSLGESAARAALGEKAVKSCGKPVYFVAGGATRRISVHHALSLLDALRARETGAYVLIHDGARPWVDGPLIDRVIDAMLEYGAAIPVVPLTDTPKMLDEAGAFIEAHPKRAACALAQTPQGFYFDKILAACEKAAEEEFAHDVEWTDDAEIYGAFAGPVAVVAGDVANRKITFPADIEKI